MQERIYSLMFPVSFARFQGFNCLHSCCVNLLQGMDIIVKPPENAFYHTNRDQNLSVEKVYSGG